MIDILIKRKLHEQAFKRLCPVIEELKKLSLFPELHKAHNLMLELTVYYPKLNRDYKFRENFFRDFQEGLENSLQVIQFDELSFQFFQIVKKIGDPRNAKELKAYKKLYAHPLLHLPIESINNHSLKKYIMLKGTLASMNNVANAYEMILDYVGDFKARFSQSRIGAVLDLYDMLIAHIIDQDRINRKVLLEIESDCTTFISMVKNKSMQIRTRNKLILLKLHYYILEKEFDKGLSFFNQINTTESRQLWEETPLFYLTIFFGARFNFLVGKIEDSLSILNELVAVENRMAQTFYVAYRFLFILCHLKLKNYQLIESAVVSLSRKLRKSERLYAPEKAMLLFLKNSSDIYNMDYHLARLSKTLLPLKNNSYHKAFFSYADFDEWLEIH